MIQRSSFSRFAGQSAPGTDVSARERAGVPPATHAELLEALWGADAPSLPSADHVLVVGGPGGTAFDAEELRCLAGLYAGVVGQCHLVVDRGSSASGDEEPVLEGLIFALEQAAGQSTLIVVEAHSVLYRDGLTLTLDEGVDTLIGPFFDAIASTRVGVPVQLFLGCCKGQLALAEAHRLPKGSVVVVLSPGDDDVKSRDFDALSTGFGSRCDNAFGLLQIYCVSLKSRTPPAVCMPDGSVLALEERLGSVCRKSGFTDHEKALIHQQLDGIDGEARVHAALRCIESGEYIPDRHYGMALAIAAVLGGVTVGPSGGVGPRLEPSLHDVLQALEEPIHPEPAPLPSLNLDSPAMRVLLGRPNGTQVLLSTPQDPRQSIGFYNRKKRSNEGAMSLKCPKGTLHLTLDIDPDTQLVHIVAIEGRQKVLEHFCQLGVLQAPAPRLVRTLADPSMAFFD
jgi:hypothetical protein